MKSQKQKILEHLKRYGQITSWIAINHYGITRLAARIPELKDDGHKIGKRTLISVRRKRYAEYYLIIDR